MSPVPPLKLTCTVYSIKCLASCVSLSRFPSFFVFPPSLTHIHTVKIVSGRAPIYVSTKLLINQSSRNSSRKLNVPIQRIYLFKSSLVYSGPALWNSLPCELRLPVSHSMFKKRLTLHMLSLLGVTLTMIIDIYHSMCCVVLLQAAYTFLCSMCMQFSMTNMFLCTCARVCLP